MAKVHIVGAGPAGSIAAISACREGHRVVVSEEHKEPGLPEHCSGLFSKAGLDTLRSFINYRKFTVNDMWGANIHFAGEKLIIRSKRVVGYVCRRSEFDRELAATAETEGAKIKYGERITDKFHSPNIIGADGPNSIIASHFKMGKIKRFISTMRATCKYPVQDRHVVQVYLNNTMFPGFFGWVIPHNEHVAEIAVGVELPNSVSDSWKKFLKMLKVETTDKPNAAIIPVELREQTAKVTNGTNVMLVGDAAGQVKATTGGGVIYGGNCAVIAGRNATQPMLYELEWRSKFGGDMMLHRFISDFIASKSEAQLRWMGRRLRAMRFDEYLSTHGSMDSPSSMLKPQVAVHIIKNVLGGI